VGVIIVEMFSVGVTLMGVTSMAWERQSERSAMKSRTLWILIILK